MMRPVLGLGGVVKAYTKEVGDRIELIAKGGRLVAIFDKQKDQTFLSGGQLFGFGNQLMNLLHECD
jgi:hypothetical protein